MGFTSRRTGSSERPSLYVLVLRRTSLALSTALLLRSGVPLCANVPETPTPSLSGEGWEVLPDGYDDGGFIGANMERPAVEAAAVLEPWSEVPRCCCAPFGTIAENDFDVAASWYKPRVGENENARLFYETEALRAGWSVRQLDRQKDALLDEIGQRLEQKPECAELFTVRWKVA